jgi:hypothetical protein
VKHNLPESILVEVPKKMILDATGVPKRILVETVPNFPTSLKLEYSGPTHISVIGIPETIQVIHDIPKFISLIMPENPVVKMQWDGVPVEMKASPELEKLLHNLVIPPK